MVHGPTLVALVAALSCFAGLAHADPLCERTRLEATLSADLQTIEGTVTCFTQSGGPLSVATYPRLLRTPRALNDVNSPWFYPEGFSAADMQIWRNDVAWEGDGAWQNLPSAAPQSHVTLQFRTRIPTRNGTFGTRLGVAYLLGGWHPVFGNGSHLEAGRLEYRIQVPPNLVGFVGSKPFGQRSARLRQGIFYGRQLPMLAAAQAEVIYTPSVILVVPAPTRRTATSRDPMGLGLRDATAWRDTSRQQEIISTLADGAAFARSQGVAVRPLIAVVTPLRAHLVEAFDLGLAISDRAFHLLDFEMFLGFHRASLWREQFSTLLLPHAQRVETVLPPDFAADFAASALRDGLFEQRYGGRAYAPDLLDRIAIIPEIDALIFAPQLPFVDTYYNAIDETQAVRLRLDDFYHDYPRGKLLYEKLKDRLGALTVDGITRTYVSGSRDLFQAGQKSCGYDVGLMAQSWLGPYPRVNYTIALKPAADAQHTTVAVCAAGPDIASTHEPLTVQVTDRQGVVHRARRDEPGDLTVPVADPIIVELDPDGRLVELWHPDGFGARFDNRLPPRWRFLLNEVSGVVSVTNRQISMAVGFSLRRIHDLKYGMAFRVTYSPSALGVSASLDYNLGQEITPLRLAHSLGLTLAYNRLRVEYGASTPGDQVTLGAGYRYDTRLGAYSDFEGEGLAASLLGGLGRDTHHNTYAYAMAGAAGLKLFQLSLNQALVARLRGDIALGSVPSQAWLRLGGRYTGARGFEVDESRGSARVLLSAEHRHTLQGESRGDLLGLVMLTRLEGAVFADATYMTLQDDTCRQNMFYDVGYGLRFLMDVLNISPISLQLDVGFPINRCPEEAAQRLPFTVYLGFVQSFSTF